MQSGQLITYEDALVSSGYKFNYGMGKTIGLIFPEYKYDLLDTKGNLHFFKLINKQDTVYLILENINKKRIKIIYGLNENLFNEIFNRLIHNKVGSLRKSIDPKKKAIDKNKSVYIKSRWSSKNIILDTIIVKIGSSRMKL
jgi:hypothetical protein